jgi:methyl-accepting chemotaxis protein
MKTKPSNVSRPPFVFVMLVGAALVALLLPASLYYFSDGAGSGFVLVYPVGTALAAVALLFATALMYRFRKTNADSQDDRSATQSDLEAIIARVSETALDSESAGRKLAIQVADTLAATARIASRAAAGKGRVRELSDQVAEGAAAVEEIHAAIESLARRISEQGHVVGQSAAAVEQMSASIESVANVARSRQGAAQQLLAATDEGNSTVARTEKIIGDVVAEVGSVHRLIEVIDDIAARTNLLAMNAAIEAAHAGASGRGFAVVAEEIRNLAERTAENARQVAGTLKTLGEKITEARGAGTETGSAFKRIETEAREVSDAFREIGGATEELAGGTREVVSAVETLRTISSEIVGSAEEMRVGAQDVTRVIATTRDTAVDTVETITVIGESSTNVTEATERISTLSIANSAQIDNLIRALQDDRVENTHDDARRRLHVITMMLKHISLVARVRLVIDGRITAERIELKDFQECDLGRWIAREGKTAISAPDAYHRLADAHRRLHDLVARVVIETDTADREALFLDLLESSRVITELLTTFHADSVRWTPDIAVDVSAFDKHHKKLFALIDKLYKALQSGAAGAVLTEVFDELIVYTDYHFSTEEAVFEHFGYPQCAQHRSAHAELVTRVKQLRADIDKGKTFVAADVMEFLRDWVTGHIRKCDKLYTSFLADKNVDRFLAERERKTLP